ncbi:1,2-dihydroxy-3-keto-5-methylthiopentene dioxygenase [Methylomarinovum tepidoasis]|uniref:Acireductone dioxygenase n=1 Tax=Methylomarinovum tepidoasis TaxID=2840183 RepID=A0AAU9CZ03_9GAMM|nr:acireductone dioxygenase [Methylomarinovum sp. IN45]BCX89279.1 1,2-dihydroxy-3-keto-5-methylthiopentene dioxygenase [Methylomarinovum sp. IN45]
MSLLTVSPETGFEPFEKITDPEEIAARLDRIGVLFERWEAGEPLPADAGPEAILAAYADPVERLKRRYGFKSADVIAVTPDHPDREALRAKFLSEHTHSDFEVRFFVGGRGLFYLHPDDKVHIVLCEAGDLISVPAGARHWFDMGARPELKCIRLFTTPEGWQADYTGSDIAARFPRLEDWLAKVGA